jgi:hypothetical protein
MRSPVADTIPAHPNSQSEKQPENRTFQHPTEACEQAWIMEQRKFREA